LRKILFTLLVCCLVAAVTPSLQADTFGQAFTGAATGTQLGNGPFTLGWSFDVTGSINVTGLAVYHDNGAALLEAHQVGIWDSLGNLVLTATVPAGGCGGVADQLGMQTWCTVDVNKVLGPGTYIIGATWDSLLDDMIFPGTLASEGLASVNGPSVSFIQDQYIAGGFADPTNSTGELEAYFGPNFRYTSTVTTPEPGTLSLLGIGLLGAVGVIRRKLNV
jgi:hypothetical protein